MLSLFWVLLVVEQPAVNANRAMTLTILNDVRICFIFVPRCFGLIWFQRSFAYKVFLISSCFVARSSLSCHTFVTLRKTDALELANLTVAARRLTMVTLWLIFTGRTPFMDSRDAQSHPSHGVRSNKQI
jgi:hypothetical protein